MAHSVFGIRHHGPGSAASLASALEVYAPDAVLIEGPPECDELIALAADPTMKPPVALLVYAQEDPRQATFFPFAEFSPEWQAIGYALARAVPVRFFDLPQTHMLALESQESANTPSAESVDTPSAVSNSERVEDADEQTTDPWWDLACAAGFADPEALWDRIVEQRRDATELFTAIAELMTTMREARIPDKRDLIREAWMRKELRAEMKVGRERIAVVCGAMHGPALIDMPSVKQDSETLKGLPKLGKTAAAWVPWSNGRLTRASGYGAGITSPGWYEHLWQRPEALAASWMSKTAAIFRAHDLDITPAHAIEATRLAETLAALRGRPHAALDEVIEAIQTVYCFGDATPLRLVQEKLVVGERLGEVPESAPEAPLVADLRREQRRLRLAPEATQKLLDLDLRKENDRARSQLLHRLTILGVVWGRLQPRSTGTGTFHELWDLAWGPELSLALIEAGRYGNRIVDATLACLVQRASATAALPDLAAMLDAALKAGLPQAVEPLVQQLDDAAAHNADVGELMAAFARLTPIARYGDVRKTDLSALDHVLIHYFDRIAIGLPLACANVSDDAASLMVEGMAGVDGSLRVLERAALDTEWIEALRKTAEADSTHALVAGRGVRFLLDRGALDADEAARRLGLALSPSVAATHAAWLEGFLAGSGLLLVHQPKLLAVLDRWVCELSSDTYKEILPLVRRAFARFAKGERRQIGQTLKDVRLDTAPRTGVTNIDWSRARRTLPLLARYLGIERQA
jgi:hypothetical protein